MSSKHEIFDIDDSSLREDVHVRTDAGSVLLDEAEVNKTDLLPSDLQQQVQRMQDLLEEFRLREKIQTEQLRNLKDQIRRAKAIQQDLLPESMPTLSHAELHVVHQPLESLSGDCYDVVRLDDHRVAFALADATDHGLPAAILATYVQRALRGVEWKKNQPHALSPDEVLKRINTDLLNAQLQDCQSIAAIYGIYDESTRILRFARGGVPYPILIRKDQAPGELISEGPILGMTANCEFETVEIQLQPGDRVVLHTDGLEALLLDPLSRIGQQNITSTSWVQSLTQQSTHDAIKSLRLRIEHMDTRSWKADDLTVLILDVHDTPGA